MGTACRITPKIKNTKGELVDSILHEDLSLFFNDKVLKDQVWMTTRSDSFKSAHKDLATDKNGEVTVDSLVGQTEVGELVSNEKAASAMDTLSSGRIFRSNPDGVKSVARMAAEHNERSPIRNKTVATVEISGGTTKMAFAAKTDDSMEKAEALAKGLELNDRLTKWLNDNGIGIEYLTEAEEGAGIDALTDFTTTRRTADGLASIIRIAKGEKGLEALPEEAAHVAVAALMGKDKNVDRALTVLRNNEELVREVLGDNYNRYSERYKEDNEKLIHEAAGHLLRDALIDESGTVIEAYDNAKRYKSLWRRMADAVMDFFKRLKSGDLQRMLYETKISMKPVARKILDDSCYVTPDFSDEIKQMGELFALTDEQKADLDNKVRRMMKDTQSRMRKIPSWVRKNAQKKSGNIANEGFYTVLKDNLQEMSELTKDGKALAAIEAYMRRASEEMTYQLSTFAKRYENAKSDYGKAYILNNINDMCKLYSRIANDLSNMIEDIEGNVSSNGDKESVKKIKQYLNGGVTDDNGNVTQGLHSLIANCRAKINKFKLPLFVEYVSKFIQLDNIYVPKGGEAYGKNSGEKISLAEQMLSCPDVGSIDHWMLGASLSNCFPVQVFQRMLNIFKLKARQEWIGYRKQMQELTLELEKAGYQNQEFMFERDDKGKLTGQFIKKDSKEYVRLDNAQKKYYDAVMEIKHDLDSMLPNNMRHLLNAPKIRKDFIERLEGDESLPNTIKEQLKEDWTITSDDEYNLLKDTTLVDYDGNEIRVVPIRFLSFAKGESMEGMSLDMSNIMTRYAQMCTNYSIMSRLMPMMELGRSIMEEGQSVNKQMMTDKDGNKTKTVAGKTRGEDIGNNTMDRINDLLESELYGFKTENVETNILGAKISMTAISQKLMALTAMSQYMLSPAAAIQNDLTAQLQAALATTGKKYYNKEDLAWAHETFTKNIMNMFGDVGKRVPDTKISLFNELFNVMQKDEFKPFNHKGVKRYKFSDNYCLTSMGEYHANTVLALALAHRTILKDSSGREINLWDALEVVDMATKKRREAKKLRSKGLTIEADVIEDEIKKHKEWSGSQNKYLVLKDGVTKQDGTEFVMDSDDGTTDLETFTRKSMHVSHMLNGIYNSEDAAKWQRYIGGQLLGMYRKWIAAAWYRRMNGLNYSLDENEWTEGYYRTAFRVLFVRGRSFFDKNFAATIKGQDLTELEKSNLRTAGFEMGAWLTLILMTAILKPDKKKKHSFAYNQMYYFTARSLSEIGSMTPTGVVRESMRIAQNASAVLPTINNLFEFASATINPYSYAMFTDEAIIKNGKYKGMSKWQRAALKLPFLPAVRQWVSFLHPEDAVRFYE